MKRIILLLALMVCNGIAAVVYAQKTVALVGADFSQVKAVPNPWRSDRHANLPLNLTNLPAGSTVKIFTISGHLVKTLTPAANSVSWDLTNNGGDKVASGVYFYVVTVGDQKGRGKLVVIK